MIQRPERFVWFLRICRLASLKIMTDTTPIYLDHSATSALRPEVLESMMPWLTSQFGNPSSVYRAGREARHALESSRAKIASLLGVGPAEIIFTSGGSESNGTVIASHKDPQRPGVLTSSIEHEAILEPVRQHTLHTIIQPDSSGRVTPSMLSADQLDPERLNTTGLASFMLVNNELGAVNPIADLCDYLHQHGILVHTDAAQAVRTIDLIPIAKRVDYLSMSGHKFGAPKGSGILLVKAGVPYKPLIRGGGQEQDRRAGTENVAAAVGLATGLEVAVAEREAFVAKCVQLRDELVSGLRRSLGDALRINTSLANSSPHILNISILKSAEAGLDGEMLILGLDIDGLAVSAGSACSSGTLKTSHVLGGIGVSAEIARGALRLSMGPQTTSDEIRRAMEILSRVAKRML